MCGHPTLTGGLLPLAHSALLCTTLHPTWRQNSAKQDLPCPRCPKCALNVGPRASDLLLARSRMQQGVKVRGPGLGITRTPVSIPTPPLTSCHFCWSSLGVSGQKMKLKLLPFQVRCKGSMLGCIQGQKPTDVRCHLFMTFS